MIKHILFNIILINCDLVCGLKGNNGKLTLIFSKNSKEQRISTNLADGYYWKIEGNKIYVACIAENFPLNTRIQWVDNKKNTYNKTDFLETNSRSSIILGEYLDINSNGSVFSCEAKNITNEIPLQVSEGILFLFNSDESRNDELLSLQLKPDAELQKINELIPVNGTLDRWRKFEGKRVHLVCTAKLRNNHNLKLVNLRWMRNNVSLKREYFKTETILDMTLQESDNFSIFYCQAEYTFRSKYYDKTSDKIVFVYKNENITPNADSKSSIYGYYFILAVVVIIFVLSLTRTFKTNKVIKSLYEKPAETLHYAQLSLPPPASSSPPAKERAQYCQIIGVRKPKNNLNVST